MHNIITVHLSILKEFVNQFTIHGTANMKVSLIRLVFYVVCVPTSKLHIPLC